MTCDKEENEEIANKAKMIEAQGNAYYYIGCKDRHLVRLLHCTDILSQLCDEVIASDQYNELYEEMKEINDRLIKEIEIRMLEIFS